MSEYPTCQHNSHAPVKGKKGVYLGVALTTVFTCLFLAPTPIAIMKLAGVLSWSWWGVLAPWIIIDGYIFARLYIKDRCEGCPWL